MIGIVSISGLAGGTTAAVMAESNSASFGLSTLLAFFTGTAFAGLVAGLFARRLTAAQAKYQSSEARTSDAVAVGKWIENAERQAERIGKQNDRIESLEHEITAVKSKQNMANSDFQRQINDLVDRERHQLARIAAHTVWDELVVRKLIEIEGPEVPDPPPLTSPGDEL